MRFHVLDAFADADHLGNPAAVVILAQFPPVEEMQRAARRIGLPTTAFVLPRSPGEYAVRWFTPHAEINVCGHATLASAAHLFATLPGEPPERLAFRYGGGVLDCSRRRDLIGIDLPATEPEPFDPPADLVRALGVTPLSCRRSPHDVMVELPAAADVRAVAPDFPALGAQPFRGHVVTAPGGGVDFVSRTFFPTLGVDEDEVCVSAHALLVPFWAGRLGRTSLTALQLSPRGGRLAAEHRGDRVVVYGSAVARENGELDPTKEESLT